MSLFFILYIAVFSLETSPRLSNKDGLYLPIDEKKCYSQEMHYQEKSFCVPDMPLISVNHFQKIYELRTAGQMEYFDVDIDMKGTRKLYLLQNNLKGLNLAFIIDNKIVGLVELDSDNSANQIRFFSVGFETPIQEIHDYLDGALKSKKK
jgi:hypothetical protein